MLDRSLLITCISFGSSSTSVAADAAARGEMGSSSSEVPLESRDEPPAGEGARDGPELLMATGRRPAWGRVLDSSPAQDRLHVQLHRLLAWEVLLIGLHPVRDLVWRTAERPRRSARRSVRCVVPSQSGRSSCSWRIVGLDRRAQALEFGARGWRHRRRPSPRRLLSGPTA